MPQIEYNGVIHEFPDDFTDADIAAALAEMDAPAPKEEQGSGGASLLLGAAQMVPAAGRSVAGFVAEHPALTQKTIGAGVTATASGIGGMVGGIPGAMGGGMIRGLTPTQAAIREMAGRAAGETPKVARQAAQGLGIINYGKEFGTKINPADIIPTKGGSPALDAFAKSQGKDIVKIYDQFGNIVAGPEAMPTPKAPGVVSRSARAVARGVGRVMSPLQAGVGITDFAQTVEPTRTDIGVMGIGRPQPTPQGAELEQINQRNIEAMNSRQKEQAAQREAAIDYLMKLVGLR